MQFMCKPQSVMLTLKYVYVMFNLEIPKPLLTAALAAKSVPRAPPMRRLA